MEKSIAARRKAQQMARNGQIGRAIEEMERIVQSGETDPYDFVFHGDLLVRGSRQDEAVSIYEEAVSAYERIGLYRNAIAICKKILRVRPTRSRIHRRLGDLYSKEGLLGDAVEQFLLFLDRADGEAPAEEFIETLERVSEIAGSRIEVKLRLADLYARAGHEGQAARLLGEVAEQASGGGGTDIARALRDRVRNLTDPPAESSSDAEAAVPPVEDASFVYQFDNNLQEESEVDGELESERSSPIELEPERARDSGIVEADSLLDVQPESLPAEVDLDAGPDATAVAQEEASFPAAGSGFDPVADSAEWGGDADGPVSCGETGEAGAASVADASQAGRLQSVEEALGRANWTLARQRAEELREELPDNLELLEKLILACESMGDRLATVRYLILLGDLKINEEDLEGSLACFLQVLDLDPGNATAHRRVTRFREMNLKPADRPTREAAPGIREVLASGEAQVTIRDQGGSESEEWVDLVDLLQQFQDGVRSLYRPGDYAGHYDLGVSHQEMGLYEEAIEEFDFVLEMEEVPAQVIWKAQEMRGVCLQRLERHREAIGAFRSSIEAGNLPAEERRAVEYHLAVSLEAVGETEEAKELFMALSEPEPSFLDSAERYRRLAGSLPSSA